ncbi:hypothetical protein SynPROS71_02200 [Synechococcus sp. PROS-7-1]|nr:hypothetical protein SynPROS71_02200 [Synechococcus sp. PROS-7-1]
MLSILSGECSDCSDGFIGQRREEQNVASMGRLKPISVMRHEGNFDVFIWHLTG